MLVYVAGPLDDGDRAWLEETRDAALPAEMAFFWPLLPWNGHASEHNAEAVCRGNRGVIAVADGMIAFLDDSRCFGTIREIEYATAIPRIPVVVVTKTEVASLMSHDVIQVESFEEAIMEMKLEVDGRKVGGFWVK